jgi:hypothetical protein
MAEPDDLSPIDPDVLRAYIAAQQCPWCLRTGFQVLARYTQAAHGVDRWELRALAGITYSASVCAPEVSERLAEVGRERSPAMLAAMRVHARKPHRVSAAGRAINTAKIKAAWSPEVQRKGTDASAAAHRKPHLCTGGCGRMIMTSTPATCSPECRRAVQAANLARTRERLARRAAAVE